MNTPSPPSRDTRPCGLLRRLAAIFYDGLLLTATLFIATLLLVALNKGQAIPAGNALFTLYLVLVSFAFFGLFWTRGGQTLGMKSWRVRVQQTDGRNITWRQATVRFLGAVVSWAALGAGFLWAWMDAERRTWHDIWSGTVLVVLPRRRNHPRKR